MSMNWKIAQSICNKITRKCPIGTFRSKLTKEPESEFALQTRYGVFFGIGNHDPNGTALGKVVCSNYESAIQNHICGHVRFLNFNSEQERYNAWQSYLTKFARFCVMIDESTKLAPYMDDYSEPWTDKRFKEYFGLTDIEWQLIDTVIKD